MWVLTEAPLDFHVFALCHGDHTALDLWDWSLYMLQQITDGVDVGVGQVYGSGPE